MTEVMLGMPGETADTMRECVQRTLELDSTVVGYTLGIRLFPYSPLGIRLAKQSGGHQTVRGLQSNTAVDPIVLTPADACTTVDYERQFLLRGREPQSIEALVRFAPAHRLPRPRHLERGPRRSGPRGAGRYVLLLVVYAYDTNTGSSRKRRFGASVMTPG